jgi:hypothetical protein
MSYQKQGFYSGGNLYASQLEAMEDGIINAENLAEEAKDSVLNLCGEYDAFEPITWDGVVGDREIVDLSGFTGENVYAVKISDAILTYEDYLGATIKVMTPDGEAAGQIVEEDLIPADEIEQMGMCGVMDAIATIIDVHKANAALGANLFKIPGTYALYSPDAQVYYVSSLSKTTIKKIDEKFLPELASGANMEKGTGVSATQQLPDGVADGFDFTDKNASATTLDPTLTGIIPYGATGTFACAFGGKCAAMGKRSHAEGTTTIAKGDYSHTEGNATVTLGANSHAEGAITTAFGGTSHAEGRRTLAHGEASHAEGVETEAHGEASHAEGVETEAHGEASHAEGELTKTRGYSSHAEGGFTETGKENDENLNGLYAHAEGAYTKAYGQISHAEGVNTEATGYASHVGGMNTIADQSAQTVIGKFNDPNAVRAYSDPRGGSLFQIGIGSSDTDRKNAINILGDGDIVLYFNGEYYSLNKIIATLGGFKDDTKAQD